MERGEKRKIFLFYRCTGGGVYVCVFYEKFYIYLFAKYSFIGSDTINFSNNASKWIILQIIHVYLIFSKRNILFYTRVSFDDHKGTNISILHRSYQYNYEYVTYISHLSSIYVRRVILSYTFHTHLHSHNSITEQYFF